VEAGAELDSTEDLIGIRIVCNNLSDLPTVVELIKGEGGVFSIKAIKDLVRRPTKVGYRAVHILTEAGWPLGPPESRVPCEVQVRTLAQDTWAHLSRDDLYRREAPRLIGGFAKALSDQLAAIDEMAQLIRDEQDKVAESADGMGEHDPLSGPRLALLYRQEFGEEIYEGTLAEWHRLLEDAEIATIGEVRELLQDRRLAKSLEKSSERIRGRGLEPTDLVLLTAVAIGEGNRRLGLRAARKQMQGEWDEITSIARGEVLPDSIEEFAAQLKAGDLPLGECLAVLDCFHGCARCGESIFNSADDATRAVLEYYDKENDIWGIQKGIEGAGLEEGYYDNSRFCDYCGYMMNKDD
jgi:hypothetical protein